MNVLNWWTSDKSYTSPMYMCLSKRPGLIRAGSRISARLVPAKTTTLVLLLNPAMETYKQDTKTVWNVAPGLRGRLAQWKWWHKRVPSISTSSWLRVFSCSLWLPKFPLPLFLPTASISSMKRMHGAFFRAVANVSLIWYRTQQTTITI